WTGCGVETLTREVRIKIILTQPVSGSRYYPVIFFHQKSGTVNKYEGECVYHGEKGMIIPSVVELVLVQKCRPCDEGAKPSFRMPESDGCMALFRSCRVALPICLSSF